MFGVRQQQPSTVGFDECPRKREPDASARALVAGEHRRETFGTDARPVVVDLDDETAVSVTGEDAGLAIAVAQRVVEQHVEGLIERRTPDLDAGEQRIDRGGQPAARIAICVPPSLLRRVYGRSQVDSRRGRERIAG